MKLLIFFLPLVAYSNTCPKNIDSKLSSCTELNCVRNDSKTLNMVFGVKENFVTNISIAKKADNCVVEYKSEWTGTQTCKFPMKYLKEMGSMMGDSSSTEVLAMFVAMMKLAKAETKKDFDMAKKYLNSYQNKMMAKQVEIKKFMDENPKIASQINSLCKVDKAGGDAEKMKKYEGYMNRMSESMAKIQQKIQKKAQKFAN